jgi:hypothetical protein
MYCFVMSFLFEGWKVPAEAESALAMLRGRADWDVLSIEPRDGGQYPRLHLTNYVGHGIVVHGDTGEVHGNCILVSTATLSSSPTVRVNLSGQSLELWPRELFVTEDLARAATEHFIKFGEPNPGLSWVGLSGFERQYLSE